MAKIYQEQIQKAELLFNGLKSNLPIIKSEGIDEAFLKTMEVDKNLAATYNEEYDKLKADFKNKAYEINRKIDDVKKECRDAKRIIKRKFDKTEWPKFGIMDKK